MKSMSLKRQTGLFIAVLCSSGLWWGCPSESTQVRTTNTGNASNTSGSSERSKLEDVQGEAPPEFSLKDLEGQSHSLDRYRNKVVLVNFWATWCEPCKKEFPHFQSFLDKYQKQGFEVLAISTDEGRTVSAVGPTVRRLGYSFTVLLDLEGRVLRKFSPKGNCPYSVLLDRQGKIRMRHEGYNPGDETALEKKVQLLLREK